MKRRVLIKPRRPIFVGCEGESEVGYVALLQRFARDAELPVHIDPKNLAPAGDPLDRVNHAIKHIEDRKRRREPYFEKFILLDSDQISESSHRTAEARMVAQNAHISLIWQTICHESFLLRHLPNCQTRNPPTSSVALSSLRSEWPEYYKGMSSIQLATRIDLDSVIRAARVEHGLNRLIEVIGFL